MLFTCSDNQKAAIDFRRLECLRLFCRQILQNQVPSLNYFAYEAGYQHVRGRLHISVSSSATCILSLVATDSWKANKAQTKALLHYLVSKKSSAGLPENNPFTIAWVLEGVTALEGRYEPLDPGDHLRVGEMEEMLQQEIKEGAGGVRIKDYPPSAYLTQLVVRTLRRRGKLTEESEKDVNAWAWAELTRQLALIQAKARQRMHSRWHIY